MGVAERDRGAWGVDVLHGDHSFAGYFLWLADGCLTRRIEAFMRADAREGLRRDSS